jgi:exosome complex RNA-binding protein Csl4
MGMGILEAAAKATRMAIMQKERMVKDMGCETAYFNTETRKTAIPVVNDAAAGVHT